jgi:hypothetical protein
MRMLAEVVIKVGEETRHHSLFFEADELRTVLQRVGETLSHMVWDTFEVQGIYKLEPLNIAEEAISPMHLAIQKYCEEARQKRGEE